MITDKTKPHAIFLDIDGTLCNSGKVESLNIATYPEINIRAISKARSLGHKVFINTGRGFAALPETIFEDIELDGAITALGTHILVEGKVVYSNPIDKKLLDELVEYTLKTGNICRFQGEKVLLSCNGDARFQPLWKNFTTKQEFYDILGDDRIYKVTADRDFEGEYLDFVRERFDVVLYNKSGEARMMGDDKAKAMQRVLDFLGIPTERSIAMGDSENDREVLLAAGTSVAMANSPDSIKEICDMVTLSDVEGGVGKAIEELLLN